jgi:selenocysteine lyase/cysteine desulfurase
MLKDLSNEPLVAYRRSKIQQISFRFSSQVSLSSLVFYGKSNEYSGLTYGRWLGTVLQAMGLSRDEARAAVRFSLGVTSTESDIDRALEVVPRAVEQLRGRTRSTRPSPALR